MEDKFSFPDLIYGFSRVADGNMSFKWSRGVHGVVIENRRAFLGELDVAPENCVAMSIGNSDTIAVVSKEDAGKGMLNAADAVQADALVTDESNLGLFLVVADCLPVIYYDANKKVIALVHLGWKSSDLRLAGKVVDVMKIKFDCDPTDIYVFLGPGAKKTSYIFEEELVQKNRPEWQPFLKGLPNGTAIDLYGFNRQALVSKGIPEGQIQESDVDTIVSVDYFSHYRAVRNGEKQEGRHAAVVMMQEQPRLGRG